MEKEGKEVKGRREGNEGIEEVGERGGGGNNKSLS
jgi:hypothetical protein